LIVKRWIEPVRVQERARAEWFEDSQLSARAQPEQMQKIKGAYNLAEARWIENCKLQIEKCKLEGENIFRRPTCNLQRRLHVRAR
jgi:hypothetical protein